MAQTRLMARVSWLTARARDSWLAACGAARGSRPAARGLNASSGSRLVCSRLVARVLICGSCGSCVLAAHVLACVVLAARVRHLRLAARACSRLMCVWLAARGSFAARGCSVARGTLCGLA